MAIAIDLTGRKALVTGAGAGIGREIAVWLARAGAQVALLDVRADKAEETVALIAAQSHPSKRLAFGVVGDARDDNRLVAMIHEAADRLGGLDIAVNNIGMMGPLGSAPWLQTTPEMFRDVIDQNLIITGISCMEEAKLMANADAKKQSGRETDKAKGAAEDAAKGDASSAANAGRASEEEASEAAGRLSPAMDAANDGRASEEEASEAAGRLSPAMDAANDGRASEEEATGGVIINVSSGETTRPSPYMAGYGAAKAAINHLTATLAAELGPLGIRVNAIAPGTTLTETVKAAFTEEHYSQVVEATPLRRETEADELARLVVFLASDLARCITGQLILADAGAHLSRTRPPNIRTD